MKKTILRECIRQAINKSHRAMPSTQRHFTFIIENNVIMSVGLNVGLWADVSGLQCSKYLGYEESGLHSEVAAYRKARGLLTGEFEAVNIRFNRSGKLKISKPCACCCEYLKDMGCRKVHFSTDAGFATLRLRRDSERY